MLKSVVWYHKSKRERSTGGTLVVPEPDHFSLQEKGSSTSERREGLLPRKKDQRPFNWNLSTQCDTSLYPVGRPYYGLTTSAVAFSFFSRHVYKTTL